MKNDVFFPVEEPLLMLRCSRDAQIEKIPRGEGVGLRNGDVDRCKCIPHYCVVIN